MDSLEGTREQNFAVIETAIAFAQRYNAQSQNRSQISLFDIMNEESDEDGEIDFVTYPPLPDVPEWTIQEKLEREKELLGFYISGHPLDKYSAEIKMFSNLDWSHPETFAENREVRTAAIISQVKIHFDRKGNQMAFITLEDRFNSFEGVVFASVYEKYGVYVNKGEMVFVQGKASEPNENTFKMLCNEIIPIAQMRSRMSQGIQLIIDIKKVSEEDVEKLLGIIKHYPGSTSLYVEMRVNGNGNGQGNGHSAATGFVMRSRRYKVLVTDEFIESLHDLLGEKKVIIRN